MLQKDVCDVVWLPVGDVMGWACVMGDVMADDDADNVVGWMGNGDMAGRWNDDAHAENDLNGTGIDGNTVCGEENEHCWVCVCSV